MSAPQMKTPPTSAPGAATFEDLKQLLAKVGMNLSVWDMHVEPIEPLVPRCRFCRAIYNSGGGCLTYSCDLAVRVVTNGQQAHYRTPVGCCVIGVPLRRRRRQTGAAVACFPVREMLDQELLARLCGFLKLDGQLIRSLACDCIRHEPGQVDDFIRMLDWMAHREQDRITNTDELDNLSTNLTTTYEELSLLYRISGSMRVSQDAQEFLQNICNELLDVMNINGAVACMPAHPPVIEEDLVVTAGQTTLSDSQIKALITRSVVPRFGSERRAIVNNNFQASSDSHLGRGIKSLIAAPLTSEDEGGAVLVGFNKNDGDFDSVDLKLITAIAAQAAVFLTNNRLYSDLQELLMGVLHALTSSIDAKDPYTCGHSQRVALISQRLAEAVGFDTSKVREMYLAGLLHDIGKIGVPEHILCKKGRLTDDEYEDIKRHPAIGANILGGIRQLDDISAAILTHHERPDGKGYPRGLTGDELPTEGEILGLADSFDAMTSDRTYREAIPLEKVIAEIRANAGKQFDPELVETFLAMDLSEFDAEIRRPAETVFPPAFKQELGR